MPEHELDDALEKVGLAERVSSLDQPVYHRGDDLSGGERQRTASPGPCWPGSHQDLLRQDDLYREMIEQQNVNAG